MYSIRLSVLFARWQHAYVDASDAFNGRQYAMPASSCHWLGAYLFAA